MRLVHDQTPQHSSQWAAIRSVAAKIGCSPETLRTWVRRMEVDAGQRSGTTGKDLERLAELERENWELRRANTVESS